MISKCEGVLFYLGNKVTRVSFSTFFMTSRDIQAWLTRHNERNARLRAIRGRLPEPATIPRRELVRVPGEGETFKVSPTAVTDHMSANHERYAAIDKEIGKLIRSTDFYGGAGWREHAQILLLQDEQKAIKEQVEKYNKDTEDHLAAKPGLSAVRSMQRFGQPYGKAGGRIEALKKKEAELVKALELRDKLEDLDNRRKGNYGIGADP